MTQTTFDYPRTIIKGAEWSLNSPLAKVKNGRAKLNDYNLLANTPTNVQMQRFQHLQHVNDRSSPKNSPTRAPPVLKPGQFSSQKRPSIFDTFSPSAPVNVTAKQLYTQSKIKALIERPEPRLVFCDANVEEDEAVGFTAKPADDIPRNKLTEKLCRGI